MWLWGLIVELVGKNDDSTRRGGLAHIPSSSGNSSASLPPVIEYQHNSNLYQ
jgi:hypothetical protein